ncbi:N-acyl homoserine lactonase family protein [Mesorhizobium sp. 1B3]|uniref:N-acyl homoserine lactonase family protein n=1 Tax=Mesorhizobium sp. 1B3 TaxID=3243599 RepID=UPI003D966818
MSQHYEVYAIAFGRVDRQASGNFIGGVIADRSMPLVYYVWVIRSAGRVIVVDTGYDQASADRRRRALLKPVEAGLRALAIDPAAVQDVIVTHMHYDHAGNGTLFPNARYHLQDAEMAFATGRCMCHAHVRSPYDVEDVAAMVRRVYAGLVNFHEGPGTVAPGVGVHRIGGHSRGLQAVTVETERGTLVLASDAIPFYAHFQSRRVYPVIDCLPDILDGYRTIDELASRPEHIVPGHDPEVMEIFPAFSAETRGWIARLHEGPLRPPAVWLDG